VRFDAKTSLLDAVSDHRRTRGVAWRCPWQVHLLKGNSHLRDRLRQPTTGEDANAPPYSLSVRRTPAASDLHVGPRYGSAVVLIHLPAQPEASWEKQVPVLLKPAMRHTLRPSLDRQFEPADHRLRLRTSQPTQALSTSSICAGPCGPGLDGDGRGPPLFGNLGSTAYQRVAGCYRKDQHQAVLRPDEEDKPPNRVVRRGVVGMVFYKTHGSKKEGLRAWFKSAYDNFYKGRTSSTQSTGIVRTGL